MVKTASVFSRLETTEYLSGKGQGFTDKLFKINNLSGRRRGFTDKRGIGSPRQTRTETPRQTWTGVSQTDADCGLTDKRGLRFTDRRSLDFPDTCHLDFPYTLYLNFPDATHLTRRPKSGITNSAQKKWSNLQTSWRLVVKKC